MSQPENPFESAWKIEIPDNEIHGALRLVSRPGGEVLVDTGSFDDFPHLGSGVELNRKWPQWIIGYLEGRGVILTAAPSDAQAPAGTEWCSPRVLFGALSPGHVQSLSRASMLASWYDHHRFCGRCGTPTDLASRETVRVCPSCAHRAYPRLSPAMIVRITAGDRILLAHNRRYPEGVYSCVAGYVDPGETLERAVLREIREEVGLQAAPPRYVASQAWPFPHSLMLGFETTAAGDPIPDGVEITDARWFPAGDLPHIPRNGTIARRLIDHWLKGLGRPDF